jgi:pimeloyl-ACP methyl ester carboxylesterase
MADRPVRGRADRLRGDVPVALVAGALDPITPPELAAGVARQLRRARLITVPRGRHVIDDPCIDSPRASFFDAANAEDPDATCVAGIGGTPFHIPPAAGPRAGG